MSKSIAYKHQLRALARWPKDPLRPDIQFQDVIRRRIDRRLGLAGPEADRDSKSSSPVASNWNETQELEQANALYGLVGNRYLQKYPIINLLKPASNPNHYTDLIRELEEAPSRSWFGRLMKRWKGFLRFR